MSFLFRERETNRVRAKRIPFKRVAVLSSSSASWTSDRNAFGISTARSLPSDWKRRDKYFPWISRDSPAVNKSSPSCGVSGKLARLSIQATRRSRYREVVAEQQSQQQSVTPSVDLARSGRECRPNNRSQASLKDANIDSRRWRTPEGGSSGIPLSVSQNSWPRHEFSLAQQWSSKLP